MSDSRIRVRANRSTGELEVEGSAQAVAVWWGKLRPELSELSRSGVGPVNQHQSLSPPVNGQLPDVFGEFYSEFRPDVTDVDKVLIAQAFTQRKEADRTFT